MKIKDGGKFELDYVDGYIFQACFSTGQLVDMGVYKNEARDALHKTTWVVTDVNTGLAICYGSTRKDAVEKFQKVYCSKFERIVMSDEHYSSAPSCHENYYEHMTRELDEMKGAQHDR